MEEKPFPGKQGELLPGAGESGGNRVCLHRDSLPQSREEARRRKEELDAACLALFHRKEPE